MPWRLAAFLCCLWTGTLKNVCLLLASRGSRRPDRPVIGEDTVRHYRRNIAQKGGSKELAASLLLAGSQPRRSESIAKSSLLCLGATAFGGSLNRLPLIVIDSSYSKRVFLGNQIYPNLEISVSYYSCSANPATNCRSLRFSTLPSVRRLQHILASTIVQDQLIQTVGYVQLMVFFETFAATR